MSEYIDKQAFDDELAKLIPWAIESPMDNAYTEGLNAAHNALLDFPAADVAPVIHAEWISMARPHSAEDMCKCSNCGVVVAPYAFWNYCPKCGARMDA